MTAPNPRPELTNAAVRALAVLGPDIAQDAVHILRLALSGPQGRDVAEGLGMDNWGERDSELLQQRIREVLDGVPRGLPATEHWPKGANGPLAVGVYEDVAAWARRSRFMLEATLQRVVRLPRREG